MNSKVLQVRWRIGLLCALFSSGAAWGANPESLPLIITPVEGAQITSAAGPEPLALDISPANGSEVRSGDTFRLRVDTPEDVGEMEVSVISSYVGEAVTELTSGERAVKRTAVAPVELDMAVPWRLTGPALMVIRAKAQDSVTGAQKTAYVRYELMALPNPEEVPVELRFYAAGGTFRVDAPVDGAPAETVNLGTTGIYADGRDRGVALGRFGTTYTSSNPGVAAVDADGIVTPVSPGTAFCRSRLPGRPGAGGNIGGRRDCRSGVSD